MRRTYVTLKIRIIMKITAKPGTQLETIFKQFYEKIENEKEQALKMVEEFTGVKPLDIGFFWYFGITLKWNYDQITFPENSQPINMVSYEDNGEVYYMPNRCLKSSKEFIKKWKRLFKGIDGKILSTFGIPVLDEKIRMYYLWYPTFIDGRYGIEVPSSLLDQMSKIDNKQYDIEL